MPAEGMAFQYATQGEPAAPEGPIARNRLDRIGRTGGSEPARRRQHRRRPALPETGKPDHGARDHCATLPSALPSSRLRSPKSRSIPPDRPIRIWSAPASPASVNASRASERKRRFMRLRMTALPIFLVTVTPSRMTGSPSSRGRTNRTKPGVAIRRPLFAARKSVRRLIVSIREAVRPKASCGHARGARREPCGHRASPSGRGSHGDACARGGWAGRCAS